MQPVGVILEAVEIVKGRYPHGLVTPQARAIGMKVPLQCHGADRQPRARGGGVTVAHRVEHAVLIVEQPVNRIRGAVRLRTIIGRGEVGPMATHLQDHLGDGPTEVCGCPLGQAPQALGKLPFRRRLIDVPDAPRHRSMIFSTEWRKHSTRVIVRKSCCHASRVACQPSVQSE